MLKNDLISVTNFEGMGNVSYLEVKVGFSFLSVLQACIWDSALVQEWWHMSTKNLGKETERCLSWYMHDFKLYALK